MVRMLLLLLLLDTVLIDDFALVLLRDYRTIGCSYITALMLLTTNIVHRPKHESHSLDTHLVKVGLLKVDEMIQDSENQMTSALRETCVHLHQRARQIGDMLHLRRNS